MGQRQASSVWSHWSRKTTLTLDSFLWVVTFSHMSSFNLGSFATSQCAAHLQDEAKLAALIAKANYRVGVMARILGVSPSQLNSTIWRLWRQTPGEVINKHRVTRARELLRGGDPVKVVALEVGFSDGQHFCRWFKRQTGLCPSKFLVEEAASGARHENQARASGTRIRHENQAREKF